MSRCVKNIRIKHESKLTSQSEIVVESKWTCNLSPLRFVNYKNLNTTHPIHTSDIEIITDKGKSVRSVSGMIGVSTTIVTPEYIVIILLDRKLKLPYWYILPLHTTFLPFRIYPCASLADAKYCHTTYLPGIGLLSYHKARAGCEIYTIDCPLSSDVSPEEDMASIFTISSPPSETFIVEILEVSAVWQKQILWVQTFYRQYIWSIDWGIYTVPVYSHITEVVKEWLGLGLWHILPRTSHCPKNPLVGKKSHSPITLGFWYTLNLTGSVLALGRVSLPFVIESTIHDRIMIVNLQRTKSSVIITGSRTQHPLFTHTVSFKSISPKLISLAEFRRIVTTQGII